MVKFLVKKYFKKVQNYNLPTFNTAFLDWKGYTEDVPQDVSLLIEVDSNAPSDVTITSKVALHTGSTTGPAFTTKTINKGHETVVVAVSSEIGSSPIEGLIKIEGIYGIAKIVAYGYDLTYSDNCFDLTSTFKNGIGTLTDYSTHVAFGSLISISGGVYKIPKEYKDFKGIFVCANNTAYATLNFDFNPNVCQYLRSENKDKSKNSPVILAGTIENMTDLRIIKGIRLNGSVSSAPVSLINMDPTFLNTSLCTGDLKDFVTKAQSLLGIGGFLQIKKSDYLYSVVTLNGTDLKDAIANATEITVGSNKYYILAWNSTGDPYWATSVPEGAIDATSPYNFEPF